MDHYIFHQTFKGRTPPKHQLRKVAESTQQFTVVVDTVTYGHALSVGTVFHLRMGIARCHWKDDFSRREGVRIATDNLCEQQALVTRLSYHPNWRCNRCTIVVENGAYLVFAQRNAYSPWRLVSVDIDSNWWQYYVEEAPRALEENPEGDHSED